LGLGICNWRTDAYLRCYTLDALDAEYLWRVPKRYALSRNRNVETEYQMKGEFQTVKGDDGFEFRAYVSKPAAATAPGIVLLQEVFGINSQIRNMCDLLAEEGYLVVAPDLFARLEKDVDLGYSEEDVAKGIALYEHFDMDQGVRDIGSTIDALRAMHGNDGNVGTIGFCLGGKLAVLTAARHDVQCAVSYYGVGIENCLDEASDIACPLVMHFAEKDKFSPPETIATIRAAFAGRKDIKIYTYPGVDHAFASPERPAYNKPAASMAYSRSFAAFQRAIGPDFDLSALWDRHLECEFADRDLEANMKTMVAQPYVNSIPTMTGGVGYDELYNFYDKHFLHVNPKDTRTIPISRTIGADRVVDEMIFCFTHDCEIDWLLPGVAPTGKYVEIPLIAIVSFRGGKLYNEHIYWDQASVLLQVGLLSRDGLPVAGIEATQKLVNEQLPSNLLMKNCHFRRLDAPPFPGEGARTQ
jgi:carboxymethylenebutenolidase